MVAESAMSLSSQSSSSTDTCTHAKRSAQNVQQRMGRRVSDLSVVPIRRAPQTEPQQGAHKGSDVCIGAFHKGTKALLASPASGFSTPGLGRRWEFLVGGRISGHLGVDTLLGTKFGVVAVPGNGSSTTRACRHPASGPPFQALSYFYRPFGKA